MLKYLFGQGQKSKTDNETVFALMPHVVRRLDVDDLNIRPVDIGTQNVIEVRHIAKAPLRRLPTSHRCSAQRGSQRRSSGSGCSAGQPCESEQAAGDAASAGRRALRVPQRCRSHTERWRQPMSLRLRPPQSRLGAVLSLDPPMVNQPAGGTFAVNVILNGG